MTGGPTLITEAISFYFQFLAELADRPNLEEVVLGSNDVVVDFLIFI